jgi:hypothetical protein
MKQDYWSRPDESVPIFFRADMGSPWNYSTNIIFLEMDNS